MDAVVGFMYMRVYFYNGRVHTYACVHVFYVYIFNLALIKFYPSKIYEKNPRLR